MTEIEALELIKADKEVEEIYLDYWCVKSVYPNITYNEHGRYFDEHGEEFEVDWNFVMPIVETFDLGEIANIFDILNGEPFLLAAKRAIIINHYV